jgi:hypothetical protein
MSGDLIVDIEGREMEAAASASHLLDVEPDAPIALPAAGEFDQRAAEQVAHDPETGEVSNEPDTDPATGMTEVDEETARQLDAQQAYQDLDGPMQDEPDAEPVKEDPRKAKLAEIESMVARAACVADIKAADAEWLKHRAVYDDATVKTMDAMIHRKGTQVPERAEGGGK